MPEPIQIDDQGNILIKIMAKTGSMVSALGVLVLLLLVIILMNVEGLIL
jgi:hypothetical protein